MPEPIIVSESGRAIAAHHSVLVFNALGNSPLDKFQIIANTEDEYRSAASCRSR